jgi:hypothetical protein
MGKVLAGMVMVAELPATVTGGEVWPLKESVTVPVGAGRPFDSAGVMFTVTGTGLLVGVAEEGGIMTKLEDMGKTIIDTAGAVDEA